MMNNRIRVTENVSSALHLRPRLRADLTHRVNDHMHTAHSYGLRFLSISLSTHVNICIYIDTTLICTRMPHVCIRLRSTTQIAEEVEIL